MILVRKFVLKCLELNVQFRLSHIPGLQNVTADLLSRLQIAEAKNQSPQLQNHPTPINQVWELSNWLSKG